MSKSRLDLNDGDLIIGTGNNMGIDSEGHIMVDVGSNVSIDLQTGETHITAGFGQNQDDDF